MCMHDFLSIIYIQYQEVVLIPHISITYFALFLINFLLYWKRALTTFSRVRRSTLILGSTSGVSFSTTAST